MYRKELSLYVHGFIEQLASKTEWDTLDIFWGKPLIL